MSSRNPRVDAQWQDKVLSRVRAADFAYTLSRIHWDTFNTLTFKNPVPRPAICYGMVWKWFQTISDFSGIPYKRLLLGLRGEHGELGGRFHFHALVGGTNTRNIKSLSFFSEKSWRQITGNSIAEVRPYDRSLAGADYICKCLGANAYELGKFNLADSVTLSASIFGLIRGMDAIGERRRCKLQTKKQDGEEPSRLPTPA